MTLARRPMPNEEALAVAIAFCASGSKRGRIAALVTTTALERRRGMAACARSERARWKIQFRGGDASLTPEAGSVSTGFVAGPKAGQSCFATRLQLMAAAQCKTQAFVWADACRTGHCRSVGA